MRIKDGSTSSRILDILDLEPNGLTFDQLEAEYVMRFGLVNPKTLRRSVYRLVSAGLASTRNETFFDYDTDKWRWSKDPNSQYTRQGYMETSRAVVAGAEVSA